MDGLDLIWLQGRIDGTYQHYRLPPKHYALMVLTRRQYETVCRETSAGSNTLRQCKDI